ncbi:MAG: hypothetical protein QOG14_178, partial [Mycobacterium sp.]|nr:hypothetical protein [Mycobacterium sp.]
MRSRRNRVSTIAGAILLASMMIGDLGWAPSARADGDPINGTYRATSVGEWAKTNDAFHNQATVTSTWTITSSCSNAQECTGQVRTDQGWSAPLYMHDGTMWYVKHDVPNWERCPDGTAFTGQQTFTFFPAG